MVFTTFFVVFLWFAFGSVVKKGSPTRGNFLPDEPSTLPLSLKLWQTSLRLQLLKTFEKSPTGCRGVSNLYSNMSKSVQIGENLPSDRQVMPILTQSYDGE